MKGNFSLADYNFSDLMNKAGITAGKHHVKDIPALQKESFGKPFRYSVVDGYMAEKGGQFDYLFDFSQGRWERTEWKNGLTEKTEGCIDEKDIQSFISRTEFIFKLDQNYFVTNTNSLEVNHDLYEREKYGPIKRLTRCELRIGEYFFRWVPEKDGDMPFSELYDALMDLRASVDGSY